MAIAATSKIDLKEYEKEEDVTVCKLWDEIREEGVLEGEAKGIIEMGKAFNLSKSNIIDKLMDNLNIELQAAEKYYDMFSAEPVIAYSNTHS